MRRIIKLFKKGNVCVTGLVGTGKDMLFANVVARRKKPYISNTDYGGAYIPFDPSVVNIGNTYKNFINGNLNRYEYPYPDGVDFYLADCGVYFPAQYCNELNRDFGYIATFMALIRHLGKSSFHVNCQNLNRIFDKLREQSDQYITCKWCKVICGIVIQRVIVYERYQSAVDRVPPFALSRPLLNADRVQQWEIQRNNYLIAHGEVKPMLLIYRNKSKYNTRVFKEMLENA